MAGVSIFKNVGTVLQVNPNSGGFAEILLIILITVGLGFAFWIGISGLKHISGELRRVFPFRNLDNAHEARLNYVVCHYCGKGMGVLNPVYVTYENVPHIEGYCNNCRRFIRTRLKG